MEGQSQARIQSLPSVEEPSCTVEMGVHKPSALTGRSLYPKCQTPEQYTESYRTYQRKQIERKESQELMSISPIPPPMGMHIRKSLPLLMFPNQRRSTEGKANIIYGAYCPSDEKFITTDEGVTIIIRNAQPVYIMPATVCVENEKKVTIFNNYIIHMFLGFVLLFALTLSKVFTVTSSAFVLLPCGFVIYGVLGWLMFDYVRHKNKENSDMRRSYPDLWPELTEAFVRRCCPLQKPII